MNQADTLPEAEDADDPAAGPQRRCLVTGETADRAGMVRFVVGPDGTIVPDLAERLPGRGLWTLARRDIVATAVARRMFARAARAPVRAADDLPERVGALLAARVGELVALARRAGAAVGGYERARAMVASGRCGLLLRASDAAGETIAPAGAREAAVLTAAEQGAAFGRERIVHVAVAAGAFAGRIAREAERLSGFRGKAAGITVAGEADGR